MTLKDKISCFAHDIRTPLTVLTHYLSSHAPRGEGDADEMERFNNAKRNLKKIEKMVDELSSNVVAGLCAGHKMILDESLGGGGAPPLHYNEGHPLLQTLSAKRWMVIDDVKEVREQWRDIIVGKNLPPPVEVACAEDFMGKGIDYTNIKGAIVDLQFEGSSSDGFDIIEFLKRKGVANIHLCTGYYNDEAVKKEAAHLGVASIIPKPIPENIADIL